MSLLIEWLYPRNCIGCGKGKKYLCTLCENKLLKADLQRKKGFEGLISIYKYNGVIRKIIEKIKYEHMDDCIKEMAELMVLNLKLNYPTTLNYWQKEKFCLVPIPLSIERERWRGFNQAAELAEGLGTKIGLRMEKNVLLRKKHSINQANIKNYQQRYKNVKNNFEILKKGEKIPSKIIFVDDVITSGATMTEALKTWKKVEPQLQGWGLSLAGLRRR